MIQENLDRQLSEIQAEIDRKNEEANGILKYLASQRESAISKEEDEEDELKRAGIIIGQHIPSLKSKLDLDPVILDEFSAFSSNILVASDLIEQNKTNYLRRTGNLPISDLAESKRAQNEKHISTADIDVPHYFERTNNSNNRERVNKVRFEQTLGDRERTRQMILASKSLDVTKKRHKYGLTALQMEENDNILKGIQHKMNYLRNPRNDPNGVTKMLVKPKSHFGNTQPGGNQTHAAFGASISRAIADSGASTVAGGESIQDNGSSISGATKKNSKTKYGGKEQISDNPLFICEPKFISFTDYDVGQKYTQSLSFRNISAVVRSMRLIQPQNPAFQLSALKYPPNCTTGMVAPGMSVTTTLTFSPNTLGDYSDRFTVKTESGFVEVPITAQREPPNLSIPSTLNIGTCLVGDAIRVSFDCLNSGGAAAFSILSPEQYNGGNVLNPEDISATGCMRTAPFTVYPIDFTLHRKESVELTIEFVPLSLGDFEQQFLIKCDNGQIREFNIQAMSKEIKITIAEINSVQFDINDSNVFSKLFFEPINAGTESMQEIVVFNDTGLPVEYEWVWVDDSIEDGHELQRIGRKHLKSSEVLRREMLETPNAVIGTPDSPSSHDGETMKEDNDTAMAKLSIMKTMMAETSDAVQSNCTVVDEFNLFPARGVMPGEGAETFTLTFSPVCTSTKKMRAVMMVKGVPPVALPNVEQASRLEKLSLYGHGAYHRLRSWVEEIGTSGGVDAFINEKEEVADSKMLISLQTAVNLVLSQTVDAASVFNKDYNRIYSWIREMLKHLFLFRKNAHAPSDDDSSDEEVEKRAAISQNFVVVDMMEWTDPSAAGPCPMFPPIKLSLSEGSDEEDPCAAADGAALLRSFNPDDRKMITEVWLDVPNVLKVLGHNLCEYLDGKVTHEAVEYIKECTLVDLASVNISAFGEGQVQEVTLQPPVMDIGGHLSIGREWTGQCVLRNEGDAMVEIELALQDFKVITLFSQQRTDAELTEDMLAGSLDFCESVHIRADQDRLLLLPRSEATVSISVKIEKLGRFEISIPFRAVNNNNIRVDHLKIRANITGARLRFETAEVDLGLTAVGSDGTKVLSFTNDCDVPVMFMIKPTLHMDMGSMHDNKGNLSSRSGSLTGRSRKSSARSAASGDFSVADSQASSGSESFKIDGKTTVFIDPPSGMVNPQETFSVTVGIKAGKQPQRIRGMLESRLFDESGKNELMSQFLNLRGEVQAPKTVMYPLLVPLGHVYVGQPVSFSVTTENLCNLPTKFKLTRPGGDSSAYSLSYENGKGNLDAKGVAITTCKFTALTTGFIDDIIANKIFGAQVPLGFEVKAHAKGVLLEFKNLADDEDPPLPLADPSETQFPGSDPPPEPKPIEPIYMGKDKEVPLYERKCRRFVIRNFSAIPAPFEFAPKTYSIKEKPRKLGDRPQSVGAVKEESLFTRVERTDGIIIPHELGENKFHAAAGKKYISVTEQRREDRIFLYSGLGASYFIDVTSGTVPPWGVQVITLRSFNDIPGNYDDDLECTVREGEIYRTFAIPLKMSVTGCPIIIEKATVGMTEITVAGGNKSDLVGMQMLQLGYCCVNSDPLVREFYVKNNGSKQGKVKWLVRSIASKARGPVKISLSVGKDGKPKSSIEFWEDLAKDSPFKVEPDRCIVPPYGRQKFKVTLFRTDKLGKEVAKVTGSILFNEEEGAAEDDTVTTTSSTIVTFANDKTGLNPTVNNKFTIGMILEGDLQHPTVAIDKNTYVATDTETKADAEHGIIMKSHATLLFAKGTKPSDVCYKPITVYNPLPVALTFNMSVDGPFSMLDAASAGSSGATTVAASSSSSSSSASSWSSSSSSSASSANSKISLGKPVHLLPGESTSLSLAFNPHKDLRKLLLTSFAQEAGKAAEQTGALVLSYATGQRMQVPLVAKISTPFLTGSSPRVFFGTCHTAQTCKALFLLSNPTDVPARWTVQHIPGGGKWKSSTAIRVAGFEPKEEDVDDPSVFEITPNAGMVEGPTVSVTSTVAAPAKDFNRKDDTVVPQRLVVTSWANRTLNMKDSLQIRHQEQHQSEADACYPMPITVRFLPNKNTPYSCRFRFSCEFGNTFDMLLQGRGTYEEHMHKPIHPVPK